MQLTWHIKSHFLATPNANSACSRLGQSQVKIVQPIVFQTLQTACQVLLGQLWNKRLVTEVGRESGNSQLSCNEMQLHFKSSQRKKKCLMSEKNVDLFASQICLPFVLLEHLPGLVKNQGMTASDAVQTQNKKMVPSQGAKKSSTSQETIST